MINAQRHGDAIDKPDVLAPEFGRALFWANRIDVLGKQLWPRLPGVGIQRHQAPRPQVPAIVTVCLHAKQKPSNVPIGHRFANELGVRHVAFAE
jgi:hypothetical protein